jgi:hypothetical protein
MRKFLSDSPVLRNQEKFCRRLPSGIQLPALGTLSMGVKPGTKLAKADVKGLTGPEWVPTTQDMGGSEEKAKAISRERASR